MTKQGGTAVILVMLALIAAGCGGGDDGGGVITTQLTATFAATDATPDPQSVTMQPVGGTGAVFIVAIRVTDVDDFFGAGFHVTFDTTKVRFDGMDDSSSFLRDGGIDPADLNFFVLSQSGDLAITATRVQNGSGTVTGVDVPTSGRDLVILNFHAIATTSSASSPISFAGTTQVCNSVPGPPGSCTEIPVTWSGGSVVVR